MRDLKDRLNDLGSENQSEEEQNGVQSDSNIKEQLKRLYKEKHNKSKQKKSPPIEKLCDEIDAELIGDRDKILQVSRTYSMKYYGDVDLSSIYEYSQTDFRKCLKIDRVKYPEQLLFLDTETTGLAGGTGTLAFMVGLGWIKNQRFHTLQYFLPKLERENILLKNVENILEEFTTLVTYNGKSFDVPLLTTRFLLNRKQAEIENYKNIDLVHFNRALWKYSLDNCKLTTIEEDKIEFYRDNDIPGELIPSVYFNFLNNRGDLEQVKKIFTHNRYDIISMLANLVLLLQELKNTSPSENPCEDYAKGRHFRRRKKIQRSIKHYQHVLEGNITDNRRIKTLLELGGIYKKQKNYQEAIKYWHRAAEVNFPAISPLIELAKYYEHKTKEFDKALKYSQQALENINPENEKREREIKKRINRIKRKKEK